jgi:hypothetical protein
MNLDRNLTSQSLNNLKYESVRPKLFHKLDKYFLQKLPKINSLFLQKISF